MRKTSLCSEQIVAKGKLYEACATKTHLAFKILSLSHQNKDQWICGTYVAHYLNGTFLKVASRLYDKNKNFKKCVCVALGVPISDGFIWVVLWWQHNLSCRGIEPDMYKDAQTDGRTGGWRVIQIPPFLIFVETGDKKTYFCGTCLISEVHSTLQSPIK